MYYCNTPDTKVAMLNPMLTFSIRVLRLTLKNVSSPVYIHAQKGQQSQKHSIGPQSSKTTNARPRDATSVHVGHLVSDADCDSVAFGAVSSRLYIRLYVSGVRHDFKN
jgi:hypothetical protein